MATKIEQHFEALTGGASIRQMGQHSGINHSTIRRQLKGEGEPTATLVVELARAYGGNVLDALVAAGFITKDEAGNPSVTEALVAATDLELAQEILRRAADGSASEPLTDPLPPVIVGGFGNNADDEDLDIPDNVEEEWAGRYAAHPKGDEPQDHTP